jgi:7-cyano-7-deazaguanine synthase
MGKSSVGVLVSGGLDSDVLLAEMTRRYPVVWPIYIRQKLAWETVELYWLQKFLAAIPGTRVQPLQILSLSMTDVYGDHWSTGRRPVPGATSPDAAVYLPGRNLALTVKAAVFAVMHHVPTLALGSLGHNPFPDATPAFFRRWGNALALGLGKPLRVIAPYRHLSKVDVIRRGAEFPLELSFSCIRPQGRWHCGQCNKCAERHRAFRAARITDRTHYTGVARAPVTGGALRVEN